MNNIKFIVYINDKSYNIHNDENGARLEILNIVNKMKKKYDEFHIILELKSELLCRGITYTWLGLSETKETITIGYGQIKTDNDNKYKYRNINVPTNVKIPNLI